MKKNMLLMYVLYYFGICILHGCGRIENDSIVVVDLTATSWVKASGQGFEFRDPGESEWGVAREFVITDDSRQDIFYDGLMWKQERLKIYTRVENSEATTEPEECDLYFASTTQMTLTCGEVSSELTRVD